MFNFIKAGKTEVSALALLTYLTIPSALATVPTPEPVEIQALKQKVQQGDRPSILPYLRKRLVADHPQLLTSKGQPVFIAGYLGSTDYNVPSITSALEVAAPKASRHWYETIATRLHETSRRTLETPLPGGYINGIALTIDSGKGPLFSTLSLSPRLCPHCSAWESDPRTCRIKTPAGDRMDHLLVTADAEHEAAHILSSHLGLRAKRQQKFGKTSTELEQLAEENFANTYQALRMIQIFGEEGEAFQKLQLLSMVKDAQAGDVSHWSVASLHNVFNYLGKHPDLRTMPARDLPRLAAKLMAPPTRTQLEVLKKTHRYQPYVMDVRTGPHRYEITLSRLNPTRPSSFTPEEAVSTNLTLTPDKISALEALNQGKRHPSCPSVAETLRPK